MPLSGRSSFCRNRSLNDIFLDSFQSGRTTIVPLVSRSHGNVRLGSDEPAGAADNSDVPAAAMLQARSFGSALGSSRSSAQVRHIRPPGNTGSYKPTVDSRAGKHRPTSKDPCEGLAGLSEARGLSRAQEEGGPECHPQ